MRREEKHVTRRVMNMNVKAWRERSRPNKRWIDCVSQDMRKMDVSGEVTNERGEWK
jgi:hypothetical protein